MSASFEYRILYRPPVQRCNVSCISVNKLARHGSYKLFPAVTQKPTVSLATSTGCSWSFCWSLQQQNRRNRRYFRPFWCFGRVMSSVRLETRGKANRVRGKHFESWQTACQKWALFSGLSMPPRARQADYKTDHVGWDRTAISFAISRDRAWSESKYNKNTRTVTKQYYHEFKTALHVGVRYAETVWLHRRMK